jgi:hypothetical protein
MNEVKVTKQYRGLYTINVTTPKGATYEFGLRSKRLCCHEHLPTIEQWNLYTDDLVDLDCLMWWNTKRECVRALAQYVDIDFAAEIFGREF